MILTMVIVCLCCLAYVAMGVYTGITLGETLRLDVIAGILWPAVWAAFGLLMLLLWIAERRNSKAS